MTEPIRHIAQPILPSTPKCSRKKYDPRTALRSCEQVVRVWQFLYAPNENRQGSQRSNQNRWRKSVCCEVEDFAQDHCAVSDDASRAKLNRAYS
jgi:hypothetical protein